MRRWGIGTNNYYYTSSIYLEEAPWYIFIIEDSIQWICHFFPRIPLPKFIKITRNNEEYTMRDWYGTTGDLFHIYICTPIFNWCWTKTKYQHINFPYEMLKKMFPNSFSENDYFDDIEDQECLKKNLEYSQSIGKKFNNVYENLQKIVDIRMKEIEKEDRKNLLEEKIKVKFISKDEKV